LDPPGSSASIPRPPPTQVSAKPDGTVFSDGYKQSWLESISRDADLAAGYLSTAARMEISCIPVVAVWSSIGFDTSHRRVVDAAGIAERIRSRPARFSPAWVDVVHATGALLGPAPG